MVRDRFRHQPFYCEENAWWLCAEPALGPGRSDAVFLTAPAGCCPMLRQRAAPPGGWIAWDYHAVVVDGRGRVWDLDSRLPLPTPGLVWLEESFALASRLPPAYRPRFRVVPCARFRREFASDRSHMRNASGGWLRPPPPWPPIGRGHRLPRFLDGTRPAPGQLMPFAAFRDWLGTRADEARRWGAPAVSMAEPAIRQGARPGRDDGSS